MSYTVENWLDNPSLSAVQACCVRSPDGQTQTQVAGAEVGNETFEQTINSLSALLPLLTDQGLLPGQIMWSFANGTLFFVVRSDGTALGLYCRPEIETSSAAIAEFIADFVQQGNGMNEA